MLILVVPFVVPPMRLYPPGHCDATKRGCVHDAWLAYAQLLVRNPDSDETANDADYDEVAAVMSSEGNGHGHVQHSSSPMKERHRPALPPGAAAASPHPGSEHHRHLSSVASLYPTYYYHEQAMMRDGAATNNHPGYAEQQGSSGASPVVPPSPHPHHHHHQQQQHGQHPLQRTSALPQRLSNFISDGDTDERRSLSLSRSSAASRQSDLIWPPGSLYERGGHDTNDSFSSLGYIHPGSTSHTGRPWINDGIQTPVEIQDVQLGSAATVIASAGGGGGGGGGGGAERAPAPSAFGYFAR